MLNAYANRAGTVGKCRENYSLMIPFILRRDKKNIGADNENVDLMLLISDGTRSARMMINRYF